MTKSIEPVYLVDSCDGGYQMYWDRDGYQQDLSSVNCTASCANPSDGVICFDCAITYIPVTAEQSREIQWSGKVVTYHSAGNNPCYCAEAAPKELTYRIVPRVSSANDGGTGESWEVTQDFSLSELEGDVLVVNLDRPIP